MRALITGGAGFIGSHLAKELIRKGHRVTVLDDLSTGSDANLCNLKNHPQFTFIVESIMNQELVHDLVDDCDMVFHLAAAVGVRLVVQSPVHTLHTNVRGTEVVLEAAARNKRRVIITSTSEVYGKSNKVPFHEDDNLVIGPPVCGRWSYACSKAMDEFLALSYHRERQLPIVIVRLFNTVGPRQVGTYGMVLPRFISWALAGQPIKVYGDGNQSRCFGWVGDVVLALVKLSEAEDAEGGIFNIGGDEEVTINHLAKVVKEVTGSDSPIIHVPYEESYGKDFEDMLRRVPDLRRIRAAIGYAPTKNLRQIIRAIVDEKLTERREFAPRISKLVPAD